MVDLGVRVKTFKRRLAIKSVPPSMENGQPGPRGLHAVLVRIDAKRDKSWPVLLKNFPFYIHSSGNLVFHMYLKI
jgi:hypothetical protein